MMVFSYNGETLRHNIMDVITETFCECGENHAGMEKVGEMAAEGDGFTLEDLQQAAEFAISVFGCSCRIICGTVR